jgi:hypothetical protein
MPGFNGKITRKWVFNKKYMSFLLDEPV